MTATSPRSAVAPPPAVRDRSDGRLAGLALLAGCLLTTLGFLGVGFLVHGSGDARVTDPLWQPLYGVVLTGSVLVVLGLPAVPAAHGSAARWLTRVGYVGVFVPLVVLNVAETAMEAFVKPYLAAHGGVPADDPAGLATFETVALAAFLVGAVCLAVAVFRGRTAPRWVGVALLASLVTVFVLPHTGPLAFVSDWCLFAALAWFGGRAVRAPGRR
jgi:hypothetical protein